MDQIFPYANIIVGVLVIIIGFIFHWIGQLISLLDWDYATKIGLQEKGLPPEYKTYEHGIAVADVAIGWIYGIAGAGLIFNTHWGHQLVWIPGVVLLYHSISFWFWTGNQKKSGHQLRPDSLRVVWFVANLVTGVLAILVAWNAG